MGGGTKKARAASLMARLGPGNFGAGLIEKFPRRNRGQYIKWTVLSVLVYTPPIREDRVSYLIYELAVRV